MKIRVKEKRYPVYRQGVVVGKYTFKELVLLDFLVSLTGERGYWFYDSNRDRTYLDPDPSIYNLANLDELDFFGSIALDKKQLREVKIKTGTIPDSLVVKMQKKYSKYFMVPLKLE